MTRKKLAGIIAGSTVIVVAVVLLVVFHPWRPAAPISMYSLVVDVSPSGSGSVSLAPSGGKYEANTQVALTATPASGYRFVNWTGDVGAVADVDSSSAVISVNDDYYITANFAPAFVEIQDWYD